MRRQLGPFVLVAAALACLGVPIAAWSCAVDGDCADANACTTNERCDAGACVSTPADCDDANPCTRDSCDPVTGCEHERRVNGLSCSDGNPCTGEEVCQGGNCSSPPDLDCNDFNPCTVESCAPPNGCRNTPIPGCCTSDADCVDASACTQNERCESGACISDAIACDDANPCTADSCSPLQGCRNIPIVDGVACGDGDVCNGLETCQGGTCSTGSPLSCDDGNGCTVDGCNSLSGCTVQELPGCCTSDAECADVSACTVNERCVDHACLSDPLTCDDGNPCTSDGCSPTGGCTFTPVPNGQACGDLDFCNGLESCQSGACAPGTAPLCDDGNPCTVDACDSGVGCTHDGVPGCCFSDGDCVDSDACTVNERCSGGTCVSESRNCLDTNPCTVDECLATAGCIHTPLVDGSSCSNAKACDGLESCSSGACRDGTPPDCDDRNFCTADSCNNAIGCQHAAVPSCCNIDAECVDADQCTTGERCLASHVCQTSARNCSDGNPCTSDSCNPASGCVNLPAPGPCNDGIACTANDACNAGQCAGLPVNCADDNYCDGTETCAPATGTCQEESLEACSPGGRNPVRTCHAEWYVVNPSNPGGSLSKTQTCLEGDSTCDADVSGSTCTFRLSVCLHVYDSRLTCVPTPVTLFELPRSMLRKYSGISTALMSGVGSMPGAQIGGTLSNQVTFTPALSGTHCSPLVAIPVPAGGKVTLKGVARSTTSAVDKDKLKLACLGS